MNLRSSCSLLNLLLSSLKLLLFLLSAASFAPLLLLRSPPSAFGWALFAVSSTTLLSSLLGFYSQLSHSYLFFIVHIFLLLISSIGQALSFFSLFLRPDACLRLLRSERSPRDVRVLMSVEEWAMVGMFVLGSMVLMLECLVQSWWAKEHQEVAETAAAAKKRSRRIGRIRVEAMVEAEAVAEEMEERMESKGEQEDNENEIAVTKCAV